MTEETQPTKSRKPGGSSIKQQKLWACQPIITPKTVFPLFFGIAIIFTPLGGLLLYYSETVSEIDFEYTNCETEATSEFRIIPPRYISNSDKRDIVHNTYWKRSNVTHPYAKNPNNKTTKQCSILFYIHKDIPPPIHIYYRLTNFYQNERSYSKSLDSDQLKGIAVPASKLSKGGCKNLATSNSSIIYPCGLIANSIFNDTFSNLSMTNVTIEASTLEQQITVALTNFTYNLTFAGISAPGDSSKYGKTHYEISEIRPPPNWVDRYPKGMYTNDFPPIDPSHDEHFQVWMRIASLPNFRKLYGTNNFNVLKAGYYIVDIDTVFPSRKYDGTKSLVISNISPIGGRNPFLGYAYIMIGCLCGILGCIFFAKHYFHSARKLEERRKAAWRIREGKTN